MLKPHYYDLILECTRCSRFETTKLGLYKPHTEIYIGCKKCRTCAIMPLPKMGQRIISTMPHLLLYTSIIRTY